jgi:hypothetical protein
MNKNILVGMLALIAAGSWAFYPKAEATNGYMMVVSRLSGSAFSTKINISTISPEGQTQTQEFDAKSGNVSKFTGSLDQLHIVELKKLNELRAVGWRVVTSTQSNASVSIENTFILEKQ